MEMTGSFVKVLDLGQIGRHAALVSWSGYRPKNPAVDDYPEMKIQSISLDLCSSVINITHLITKDDIDDIKADAWERFPTISELENEMQAELAERWMQERLDQQFMLEA